VAAVASTLNRRFERVRSITDALVAEITKP
jgi:hypothetical protein